MHDITDIEDDEPECECGHSGSFHFEGGCSAGIPDETNDKERRLPVGKKTCACAGFKKKG